MEPHNFSISDRSGTDAAIHLLQYLTDVQPGKVIMSIDGVGAFDHVSRARMFTELLQNGDLQCLVPFVRQWYGEQSQFRWVNDTGTTITIKQGDEEEM